MGLTKAGKFGGHEQPDVHSFCAKNNGIKLNGNHEEPKFYFFILPKYFEAENGTVINTVC